MLTKSRLRFQDLSKAIHTNSVYRQYRNFQKIVELAVRGHTEPLQIVGGLTGIGKTFGVMQVCEKACTTPVFMSPRNPHAFVKHLYEHRDAPVILLDDFSSLITSPQIAEVIKMGYGPTKTVIWSTVESRRNAVRKSRGDSKYDPTIPPPSFKVNSVLIWLSNLDLTDMHAISSEMRSNIQAICSRGADPIWLEGNDDDLFCYTIWLGTAGNMFRQSKNYVSKEAATGAVNWFNEKRNYIKELSPRTLNSVATYFHRIGNDYEGREAALGKKLSRDRIQLRDIPGFGRLEMVRPSEWRELCKDCFVRS
jgi:hypothetical protein